MVCVRLSTPVGLARSGMVIAHQGFMLELRKRRSKRQETLAAADGKRADGRVTFQPPSKAF